MSGADEPLEKTSVATRDANPTRALIYEFMAGWGSISGPPEILLGTMHPDGWTMVLPEGTFSDAAAFTAYWEAGQKVIAAGAHHVQEIEVSPDGAGDHVARGRFVGQIQMKDGGLRVVHREGVMTSAPDSRGLHRVEHYEVRELSDS